MSLLRIRIVNANTELIHEAPNRQPIFLMVAVFAYTAIGVVQVAVPSKVVCIVLCRTPPVTVGANDVVNPISAARTARKRRK